jgi:hypothetical protein
MIEYKYKKVIKWIIISLITLIYVSGSFNIGYRLTGDMHNGGPFVGLLLTPFITTTMILIMFFHDRLVRKWTILIFLTFLSLIMYFSLFTILLNKLFLAIFKEYYLMHEYWIYISLTKWVLIALSTTTTYILLNRRIKNKNAAK